MREWPTVMLNDVCRMYQPRTIGGRDLIVGGAYPVYGANGQIGFYDRFNHADAEVTVTCRGATCGTVNVIPGPSWITGNAMVVTPLDKRITKAYLALVLTAIDYSSVITGAAQPQITRGPLERVAIPLPPIDEQRRIAAVLDKADELRAKRREGLTTQDSLAESIFIKMFDSNVNPESECSWVTLNEIVDPSRPVCYGILKPGPDIEGGHPYVRVVDMRDNGIDPRGVRRTSSEICNKYRRSLLRTGDLLMSIRGHVGRLAEVPPELDSANITQDSARIAVVGAEPLFVLEYLRLRRTQAWMARNTKGVAVRGMNIGDVRRIPVLLPSTDLQRRFVRARQSIEEDRMTVRTSLIHLDELFGSLRARAFRGAL
jgi:type I restriction enzyme S subunit